MLATANFQSPLFWAVLIAWIMSVVLHEFAHGIVAYWGGDYTIRERGGLTLNPFQYIDPMFSIVMPVIFLAMGGIPLPGGSTYVRRDLLRSRGWNSAVSLAGPAMNFLLFLGCALPLHPRFGWVDPLGEPSNAQIVFGCMAILQIISVILNLIPVPPLDGFQALSPWIPPDLRAKVSTPPLSTFLMIGFFLVLLNPHIFGWIMFSVVSPLLDRMGFDGNIDFIFSAFNKALFSR